LFLLPTLVGIDSSQAKAPAIATKHGACKRNDDDKIILVTTMSDSVRKINRFLGVSQFRDFSLVEDVEVRRTLRRKGNYTFAATFAESLHCASILALIQSVFHMS
jgi:hypothetical protein